MSEFALSKEIIHQDWFIYALYLSICFIIFFNVNALTIQKVGMIITSIFQKLSLIFPVIVGVLLFGENLSLANKIAIPLTLIAIVLSNLPNKSFQKIEAIRKYWYLPILVLAGSGFIEVSLFYAQETNKIGEHGMQFTTCLFGLAGIWGLIFIFITRSFDFTIKEIIAGILIGLPNFFTIYLIILGLDQGWNGALLFPINNIGTIIGTTIIAFVAFKEKLSFANTIGLVLALISVVLFSI